ncbi:MAG: hypothetical protein MZV64_51570 [Ignavibacteriales bacterium]|nr:hypothetical protein [Ignavibacteriales bacterium]
MAHANDYNFSPDGSEIAYALNPEFTKATSTNIEIYLIKFNFSQDTKDLFQQAKELIASLFIHQMENSLHGHQ